GPLYPPGLPGRPSFEAWTTGTALAAVTDRVRLGHLVLASGFRHPALLAKMATTLDHVSGGRLDLGLGSGSYAPEFAAFGIDFPPARGRAERVRGAPPGVPPPLPSDPPPLLGPPLFLRRGTPPPP